MLIDRKAVYDKYNGHCAYCGCELKKMQVDHLIPQHLEVMETQNYRDRFENLMPSCQKCNIHKHGMRLETWRRELERQVSMLKKNTQFQRALRYGQIALTLKPVIFYFERFKNAKNKNRN